MKSAIKEAPCRKPFEDATRLAPAEQYNVRRPIKTAPIPSSTVSYGAIN